MCTNFALSFCANCQLTNVDTKCILMLPINLRRFVMNKTTNHYSFEELYDTAETAVMNFMNLVENLPELYKEIMTCTTGLHVVAYDTGAVKSIKLEHRDVGTDQQIVFNCGQQGHTIKIFNNGVEVFSQELHMKLVQALHTLAHLETFFKWTYNNTVEIVEC